jgi:hypothetical protein
MPRGPKGEPRRLCDPLTASSLVETTLFPTSWTVGAFFVLIGRRTIHGRHRPTTVCRIASPPDQSAARVMALVCVGRQDDLRPDLDRLPLHVFWSQARSPTMT